jgi:hypothetical protein
MTIQKFTRTVRRDYCKAYTDYCGINIKVRRPRPRRPSSAPAYIA